MKLQQIRNATVIVDYAGKRFLVDPMLSPKGAFPAFPGTVNDHLSNPLVDLPIPMGDILAVDAVIVTHTHEDHWDDTARQHIPKDKPLFVQNEQDAEAIRAEGFSDVRVLGVDSDFAGISLIKTSGQHGSDAIMASPAGELLGEVCGVVFAHPEEKTAYLAGDTVWNAHVRDSLATHRPEIVILNAGDARIPELGSIIMGKQDVHEVHKAAPQATLVATHMESVNHATLSRDELRAFAAEQGMSERLLVPEDGETCVL
ncbi:MBL fold metallo-hydrolase [Halomonas organivorans]|uniref:L-ascorbate metabolism protein UlaG (Beta-lactamase superfamily) n=1 Tax=Halomonas organivorans TaxID=257772 RepID=A0A7W5BV93_9GAMM|nr:MBL fold metallo-hydrolase [Halomonas organivorans]MBB3139680.1 L-ascorbate metabolism protein UlaG (beta-lactamase superfamily) [Halomonas organivorans]